ncbi:MAG: FAD-binding oxidoreductase [Alphaproteobacteria bacterium]|nr:FAD-binding oxidoreductase [Alphaproteobacteria bacterium]
MSADSTDVAIIGAGIVGISVAHYLCTRHRVTNLVLIDSGDPMGLTSAKSGENYRNWWPHPVMTAFTDDSTTLMEEIARASGNRINMTRRGYALATRRAEPADLLAELHAGYGTDAARRIRIHRHGAPAGYRPATSADWQDAPDGVDVLMDHALIRASFPSFSPEIATVLHIRRAGDISGQQLGQFMLEAIRAAGGRLRRARVGAIAPGASFALSLVDADGAQAVLRADRIVNAAGPFIGEVAAMLGEALPVSCVLQQKIAFEDREQAIPRSMPFSIDLDPQEIAWTGEERALLAADPETVALTRQMPGGIHCRPDGGDRGSWIKLGWAFNQAPSVPSREPPLIPHFPDIVLRAAGRLNPSLRVYIGKLPRRATHYGGYYCMTPENWPLIGPMRTQGAFVAGALSGYGTMSACASGALCAAWMAGAALPSYAHQLGLGRQQDAALMAELAALRSKGVL